MTPTTTAAARAASTADRIIDEIDALFAARGSDLYGEKVTQLQHAVQSAAAAVGRGCADELVVASLLHDIGHLIHDDAGAAYHNGVDDLHEELGAAWLTERFPPEVVEPARLHVDSKRYLCHAEPGYHDALSEASAKTLAMQGGPMTEDEAAAFREHPMFDEAILLRRFDDIGKNPDDHRESIADYHDRLRAVLIRHHAGA